MKRYVIAAVAAAGLLFGLAGTAGAATVTPKPLAPAVDVAQHDSQTLAGHAGEGNGIKSYNDARNQLVMPSEPICPPAGIVGSYPTATCGNGYSGVVPGELAQGNLLAQNTSVGGWENAIAGVFDTPSCPGDQWTVESGFGFYNFSGPVLPVTDLHPDAYFGNPICVAAGQSEYLETYQVRESAHVIDYLAGTSGADANIVGQVFPPFRLYFHTFGFGVNTMNGNVAANLATGTLADFLTAGLTQVRDNFHRNGLHVALTSENYDDFIGTMTGGAPSVANPQTLTPGPVGLGGRFLVTVP